MKRFLPESIAGRTVLVLLVGLTLSHVISMVIYSSDRADALTILGGGQVAERIATIARLVEETAPADRPRILKAVNSPTLRVTWSRESEVRQDTEADWRTRLVEESLKLHLGGLRKEAIRIRYLDAESRERSLLAGPQSHMMGGPAEIMDSQMQRMMAGLALGRNLHVSLQLADSTWLNFAALLVEPASFWSARSILSMAVMAFTVIALSIWAIRRFTAPLVTFARAAERLGRDVKAPSLPERGPSEVRQAVRAFNRMQGRIRRFVEDRTQMVAAISHDLRTPITRLRLRAEFVEDEEEQRKMLADLDEMEGMISSTLSFARQDAATEARTVVDLAALLQSICDDMVDAGLPVELVGETRLPYNGQPMGLKRAFTNLIDNAVKYGKRARVRLDEGVDRITVQIDDDGPGIPEGEREKVFTPFYRIDRSRSRETRGSGLGLAFTRTIIRAHGGDIRLVNRTEGGLRVIVTLPR